MLNLNLGSGSKRVKNYINVDKYKIFNPDIVHDLEKFPYPFDDNSVDNIILSHILEHIGCDANSFVGADDCRSGYGSLLLWSN